jgi:hypothetical protein
MLCHDDGTFPLAAMVFQWCVMLYAHIHGSEEDKAAREFDHHILADTALVMSRRLSCFIRSGQRSTHAMSFSL